VKVSLSGWTFETRLHKLVKLLCARRRYTHFMASPANLLRYQIHFSSWATSRILEAAAALLPDQLEHDFKTADKSVSGTLVHIFRSERVWLARIEGRSQSFAADSDTFLSLLENWPLLRASWHSWSDSLSDDDCDRLLSYQDLRGTNRNDTISEIVLHVVNHSTHHRGQVSGFLRSLGITPPVLDAIHYARTLKQL
jgi:uncharacterized damage-inducible protein DinB